MSAALPAPEPETLEHLHKLGDGWHLVFDRDLGLWVCEPMHTPTTHGNGFAYADGLSA
jgi:hypothetical protein